METALSHLTSYEGFEFAEYLSISTLGFTIYYSKESNICYTLMIDVNYLLYLQPHTKSYHFHLKREKLMESTNYCALFTIKNIMYVKLNIINIMYVNCKTRLSSTKSTRHQKI